MPSCEGSGRLDHHLAGDDGAGNTRNGYGRKTVVTETGKLAIDGRAVVSRASKCGRHRAYVLAGLFPNSLAVCGVGGLHFLQ